VLTRWLNTNLSATEHIGPGIRMSSNHFPPVEMKGSRQLGGIIVIGSLDDCQYGRMRRT